MFFGLSTTSRSSRWASTPSASGSSITKTSRLPEQSAASARPPINLCELGFARKRGRTALREQSQGGPVLGRATRFRGGAERPAIYRRNGIDGPRDRKEEACL